MQPQLIAGRYQVLRAIGRGGMGTVWLCRDEVLGRHVAVKQIGALPGDSATETKRAMREARSAAALNHPNAVAVYDVVDHEGRPWLVMEYVEGQTLADEISREGRLSPQRVADVGAQLAGALARAHERRIVHRDIKPVNVLIDKAGRPKISDFGIARGHGDEQLTQIGFITGTPGYLSPELARGGDPASASDVWALGATLYEAVEGQPPYEPRSNPIALLRTIATERPRPTSHAGPLGPAIEAMMHEDPASRWDMATCARRLGGIARITALIPRVDPAETAVMVAPPIEATQRLKPVEPEVGSAAQALAAQEAAQKAAEQTVAAQTPEVETPAVETPGAQTAVVSETPVRGAANLEKPAAARARTPDPRALPAEPPVVSPDRTRSRRRLSLILVALLVVAALGVAFLLNQVGGQGGVLAGTGAPTTAAKAQPTTVPSTTAAPTTAQPTTVQPTTVPPATIPPTTAIPTTAEPTKPATAAPVQGTDRALANFVRSYYSDVTRNRNSTWARLSPRMQAAAGGRSTYDGFWRTIASVRVNQTRADAASKTAVASLTFIGKDGRRSTETHRFSFVTQGGGYLFESEG
jgi:hypothetical protein